MNNLPPAAETVKTTRPGNSLRPIHGSARWIGVTTLADLLIGVACLEITSNGRSTRFLVQRLHDGGKLVGYRLTKQQRIPQHYDIDVTFGPGPDAWECDCPDGTFAPARKGGCRHRAALYAALKSIPGV